MQDDENRSGSAVSLKDQIVGTLWLVLFWIVLGGALVLATSLIGDTLGVNLRDWNRTTIAIAAGLVVWAIFYLLNRVEQHRIKIRALENRCKQLEGRLQYLERLRIGREG